MPLSLADAKRKQALQKSAPPATVQAQPTTLPPVTPGVIRRASSAPTQLLAGDLLYLQRTIGNRAVAQMLSGGGNLHVGPANDRYEREADKVAQQVSGQPATTAASHNTVQRDALPQVGPQGGKVESGLARQIEEGKQGGQPLPKTVRRKVEGSLGADFGSEFDKVRVHTGESAQQTNQALGAKAFTHGKHIFLGAHQSPHDVQLMAHELTHTIQQGAVAPNMAQPSIAEPNMAQPKTAPGGIQRAANFPKLSHAQPQIQREKETIKFQGKSKTIEKGNQEQFKQSIGKMSSKGVKPSEQPRAVMLMGAAGSGKSSILNEIVPDRSNFVHVDPDQVKEAMPEYQRGLEMGDEDIASKVHGQSKKVTKFVTAQAIASRRNLIIDSTGNDVPEYVKMCQDLRNQNYHITLAMVHINVDEGLKRVAERAKQTGRNIPENVVRDMYIWIPQNFATIVKKVNQAYLFDNMVAPGERPHLLWETSDGKNLKQSMLDYVRELITRIEGKEIDNAPPEDESYHPPLLAPGTARYLQEGGTSRWQKETTKKKKGFAVSRKNLSEVDETLKLYRLYKSKNRGNAEEQATLLKSLESSIAKSNYQGDNNKESLTHKRRRDAMNNLHEELQGEVRRSAIRLPKVAGDVEQVEELVRVGFTAGYLNDLLKIDLKRLYEAHVALAFGQKDLAQKAFDRLNPVERDDTGQLKHNNDNHYLKRSRNRLLYAQQMLTAHHHANIGGDYGRSFAPSEIDDQRMGEITENYLHNTQLTEGVLEGMNNPVGDALPLDDLVGNPIAGGMSREELVAIRVYTAKVFKKINPTMQDIRLAEPETQKNSKGYSSISQVAVNGLSKLPPYTGGPVYRGDSNIGGLVELMRIGTSFKTSSFMSTSKSADMAAEHFGTNVAWMLTPAPNGRGRDIQAISTAHEEAEVLFPPGTKLKVVDVIVRTSNEEVPPGENDEQRKQRDLRSWKSVSGKPITPEAIEFIGKFRKGRNRLILIQEVG